MNARSWTSWNAVPDIFISIFGVGQQKVWTQPEVALRALKTAAASMLQRLILSWNIYTYYLGNFFDLIIRSLIFLLNQLIL